MTKTCTACKIAKPLKDFYKEKLGRYGRRSKCKTCMGKAQKAWIQSSGYKPDQTTESRKRAKKKWLANNKEKRLEWERRRYHLKKDELSQKRKEYPSYGEYVQRRRARKAGAEGFHTKEQFWELCKLAEYRCLACKKEKPLTEDHIVPLSKGGSDWIENIQPLCFSCNSRKSTKTVDYKLTRIPIGK